MANKETRNDWFYTYLKTGLQGLLKFEPKLNYSVVYNEGNIPLCVIELGNEKKDDMLDGSKNMIFTDGLCEFSVMTYHRIQTGISEEDIRYKAHLFIELVESQIYDIKPTNKTFKNLILDKNFYNIKITEINIENESKFYKSDDGKLIGTLTSGNIVYSQSYYY
jgi:hypothetical protein